MYCEEPATLLCDFKLGWAIGELIRERDGSTWHAISGELPPYTCDISLCRDHAENRGWLHVKAGKNSHFDSYDHCPEHRGMVDTGASVIQESEADRLRRAVHANARRRLMRERGTLQSSSPATQGELF